MKKFIFAAYRAKNILKFAFNAINKTTKKRKMHLKMLEVFRKSSKINNFYFAIPLRSKKKK